MNSYDVLKEAIEPVGVKAVASAMGLSSALVYKWCEPKKSLDDPGALNPLDRIAQIYDITHNPGPVEWLCRKTDGFRVGNPGKSFSGKEELLSSTQEILKEFSDLLAVISDGYSNDGKIDHEESKRIRREWERLKIVAETFVITCENGAPAPKT